MVARSFLILWNFFTLIHGYFQTKNPGHDAVTIIGVVIVVVTVIVYIPIIVGIGGISIAQPKTIKAFLMCHQCFLLQLPKTLLVRISDTLNQFDTLVDLPGPLVHRVLTV